MNIGKDTAKVIGICTQMCDKFILYKNGKRVDTFYYNGTFEHISF